MKAIIILTFLAMSTTAFAGHPVCTSSDWDTFFAPDIGKKFTVAGCDRAYLDLMKKALDPMKCKLAKTNKYLDMCFMVTKGGHGSCRADGKYVFDVTTDIVCTDKTKSKKDAYINVSGNMKNKSFTDAKIVFM